jgi:hypothetical protein
MPTTATGRWLLNKKVSALCLPRPAIFGPLRAPSQCLDRDFARQSRGFRPSTTTESLVAAAVQWGERIMRKIDGLFLR